jgi:hypothetical protein
MAIKLSIDKIVRSFRPENGPVFTIDELNDKVGGWVEPFKVGPVWVMHQENSQKHGEPLNELASFFFETAIYGEVIVVPPQQLPREWDLMEYEDQFVTADMVDSGFMLSLQNALMIKRLRDANPGLAINPTEYFNSQFNSQRKEEFVYEPSKGAVLDKNTVDFLGRVYEYIVKMPAQFNRGVLLEDSEVIIRASETDRKTVLELIKGICLEKEEYEKCAVLQKMEESFA